MIMQDKVSVVYFPSDTLKAPSGALLSIFNIHLFASHSYSEHVSINSETVS